MKYLVTGGNGFIGRAFCQAATITHHDTFVIDKDAPFPVDIANGTALNNMMAKCEPDWVVHLAATPGVSGGQHDIGTAQMQDIFNLRNVLQAMKLSHCKRILFVSTGSVYGHSANGADEWPALSPQTSFYAASKQACEGWLSAQALAEKITVVVLRLGTILGPGNNKGLTKDFVAKLTQDPTRLEVLGNGQQTKSYLHIDDLVSAMFATMEHAQTLNLGNVPVFDVYNVAGDYAPSVEAVANVVASEMNLSPKIEYGNKPSGFFGDVPHIHLDNETLMSIGWKPKHSPIDAVTANVRWLLADQEKLAS